MTVSIAEGNRRLLVLAEFLEKLPPERFDYGHVVEKTWGGDPGLSCGATACALGWMPTIPGFAALGLRLFRDPKHRNEIGIALPHSEIDPGRSLGTSLQVSSELFATDDDEAEYLFLPSSPNPSDPYEEEHSPPGDASASEVAAHIRKFVAGRASK